MDTTRTDTQAKSVIDSEAETEAHKPRHIRIERAGDNDGRTINRAAVGLAAAGGLAAIGAIAALWRGRGQAIAATPAPKRESYAPSTIDEASIAKSAADASMLAPEPLYVIAEDGPIVGATVPAVATLMVTAEDGPIASTPVLGTEPRLYTGTARPDMAVYSEPGNDERPAEQPDAARHARDEGDRIGSMVDA